MQFKVQRVDRKERIQKVKSEIKLNASDFKVRRKEDNEVKYALFFI